MSWVVFIDESGDTAPNSRFFTIAATVVRRANKLRPAYAMVPKHGMEPKFYNSKPQVIRDILQAVSQCDVRIVHVTVDKYDYTGRFYGIYGNELYRRALDALLFEVTSLLKGSDVDISLDRNRFISKEELTAIAERNCELNACNLTRCEKRSSDQSPCIQIADYVSGTIYRSIRDGDDTLLRIIEDRIVVARTD